MRRDIDVGITSLHFNGHLWLNQGSIYQLIKKQENKKKQKITQYK